MLVDVDAPQAAVVAVLTYGRNDHLGRLVSELAEQVLEAPVPTQVLVVDNNPDGSAADVVGSVEPGNVCYVHEPTPGISAARNRALDWARSFDAVLFIDDDEVPEPGWVRSLLLTMQRERAAAVAGPVRRQYPFAPSSRVDGMRRSWDRLSYPTGSERPAASTANLLLDLRFLRRHGLRFDERFGLSGGSDTMLTRQIPSRGGRIVWCEEAGVTDVVEIDRMSESWLKRRAIRVGNTESRVRLAGATTGAERVRMSIRQGAKGALVLVAGLGHRASGRVVRDDGAAGEGAWDQWRGWGMLTGALGRTRFDYLRS